eukprot:3018099-Alexandrium_andersonii.AAC.1
MFLPSLRAFLGSHELWLGSHQAAEDERWMKEAGILLAVNCADDVPLCSKKHGWPQKVVVNHLVNMDPGIETAMTSCWLSAACQ